MYMSNQTDVERFETDWRIAKRHLEAMALNPVVNNNVYVDLSYRIRYIEEIVIEISDVARSDKD